MSFFDAEVELILKKALVPLLGYIEHEVVHLGFLSQETMDEYHDHLMAAMKFGQPFLPVVRRLLLSNYPQLLTVLDWSQEVYALATENNTTK